MNVYEFWGGKLNGRRFSRPAVEEMASGHTPDNSVKRMAGGLCARTELDNQPKVSGYLGPMWDGVRHRLADGREKYDFENFDRSQIVETYAVLRYETQDVYNFMSS